MTSNCGDEMLICRSKLQTVVAFGEMRLWILRKTLKLLAELHRLDCLPNHLKRRGRGGAEEIQGLELEVNSLHCAHSS